MPRAMPLSDFRARRRILLRSDFALPGSPSPRQRNKISVTDWFSIVALPDDVAIQTSGLNGGTLSQLHALWGGWIEMAGLRPGPMWHVMLDAADDFQAGVYNLMVGYYRLSAAALRSALELCAIGAAARPAARRKDFKGWREGKIELGLGWAADRLAGAEDTLDGRLEQQVQDSLFRRREGSRDGGAVRRLFRRLSDYAHSRPGFTGAELRGGSNGPIYVPSTFDILAGEFFNTFAAGCVLAMVGRPHLIPPHDFQALLRDGSRVSNATFRGAFELLMAGRARPHGAAAARGAPPGW
ncbi:MAG: hypothetical protein ACRD2E_12055 [Terriglobales bacterium]